MSTLPHLAHHQSAIVSVSTNQAPKDRVLAGLIAQSHGRDACAAYLGLTDEQLMASVVRLDLPMPAERPMRRSAGPNAWDLSAVRKLIDYWIRDFATARISDLLGRSPSSIRSKARWLGLFKRDSRNLIAALPLFPDAEAPEKRRQLTWTDDLERWLADRWLSFQHHKAIARDMSAMLGIEVSPTTIASKAHRLELPKRDAEFLLQDYKTDYRRRHAHLLPRVVERRCKIRGRLFWSTGATYTSEEAKAQSSYRVRCSGMADHALAVMH